jgi:hypothetical protein
MEDRTILLNFSDRSIVIAGRLEQNIEGFINVVDRWHFLAWKAVSSAAVIARNFFPFSSFSSATPQWGEVCRFLCFVPRIGHHGFQRNSCPFDSSIQSANGQNV